MTVRKKDDSAELQIVRWGLGTNGFRVALLILVLSMHPIGRGFLTGFGFKFPDQQKLEDAASEAKSTKTELAALSDSVKDMKADMASIKANNAIINSKFEALSSTVTGFQIDFQKWKAQSANPQ